MEISTILFDVGGVCLTNGWDNISREKSTVEFSLDYEEIEKKHTRVFKQFEKGKISLDEYLSKVVFFRKRNFTREDFIKFMCSQSRAFDSTLMILEKLVANKKYRLATINNESRELNAYRIETFKLNKYFECFFSSCYLGVRKPEWAIFSIALNVLHKNAGECLYIDDREENFNSAKKTGINSILLAEPGKLEQRLNEYNIKL
ncbi:MAG TPA: HAD-IA family hydrolase [Ignavibacteriaceae bacterium]|nr:HAD-IA family hydrolase [Ignavibacteriaceae bacterium]